MEEATGSDEDSLGVSSSSGIAAHSGTEKLAECPTQECGKKFHTLEALKFHISAAHNELKARHEEKKMAEENAADIEHS